MGITFFQNWTHNKEFIFAEFSFKNEGVVIITLALFGFGVVIVIN